MCHVFQCVSKRKKMAGLKDKVLDEVQKILCTPFISKIVGEHVFLYSRSPV